MKVIHKAREARGDRKEGKPTSYRRLKTMEMMGSMQIPNACQREHFS